MEAERLDEYLGKVNSRQIRAEIINSTTLRPMIKLNLDEIKEVNVCHAYPKGARYIKPGEHVSGYGSDSDVLPYRVVRFYFNTPAHPVEISSDGSYVYVINGGFCVETEVVFIGITYEKFMSLQHKSWL